MSVVDYVYELERPLCSMSFNGIVFEDEIPGYRTLRVEGRDAFNQTIYEYSTRLNPGSRFQDWHEESKEITVTFALVSTSVQDLRKKLDRLKGLLRAESNKEAQIIFNDEPDLYYVGTVSKFSEEKVATIEHCAGQITIRCSDIRKKSVEELQLTADAESNYQFTLDYPGELPSYPKFKVNIASATDYIGFVDQDENILQFGSSSELEVEKAPASTTQLDQNFLKSWSGWQANVPTVCDDLINGHTIHGSISRNDTAGAFPYDYGTYDPETVNTWHGPFLTHTIGSTGAKNWKLTTQITQWQNTPNQSGIEILFKNEFPVFACEGTKHHFNKNYDLNFVAFEGNKQIPCRLSANVAVLGVTSINTAATASAAGHVKWNWPKGITVSAASGTVSLTFICTASTGIVNVTKTFHWSRQTIPAAKKFDVLFDYTSFNMPVKTNNKLFCARGLTLSFGGYYGTTRCNIECINKPTMWGVKPKVTSGTKANGSIFWSVPSNSTISPVSVSLQFKVTVPGTKTSTTITKTFNFTRYSVQTLRKDYSQRGDLDIVVSGTNYNNDMVSIAEVHFSKSSISSTDANCYIYLDNKHKGTINYKAEKTNGLTGTNGGKQARATITIEKIDNKYTFTIGGKKYQYTNANNLIATEVSIGFFKVTTYNTLERNSVHNIKFLKHADTVNKPSLIPNKFNAGDEVEIDCETGTILVNGAPEYGYGALGNDWESFSLKPGTNEIQCVWDQDAETEPSFDMYYREVY